MHQLYQLKTTSSENSYNQPFQGFKEGIYTITASHEELGTNAQAQFIVTAQEIPRNPIEEPSKESTVREPTKVTPSGISISADAVNGSDQIEISGITTYKRDRYHTNCDLTNW